MFMFWFFWLLGMWDLGSLSGDGTPSHPSSLLEGEVLTTGLPGKSSSGVHVLSVLRAHHGVAAVDGWWTAGVPSWVPQGSPAHHPGDGCNPWWLTLLLTDMAGDIPFSTKVHTRTHAHTCTHTGTHTCRCTYAHTCTHVHHTRPHTCTHSSQARAEGDSRCCSKLQNEENSFHRRTWGWRVTG